MRETSSSSSCDNCAQRDGAACPAARAFPGPSLDKLSTKAFSPETDIYVGGEIPDTVAILKSGWAYKYVPLGHDQRHMLTFYLPGDIFDHDAVVLPNTPLLFSTRTLTPAEVCFFDITSYRALLQQSVRARHFVKQHLVRNKGLLAKHLVDVARRRAPSRIASFILELYQRQKERGLKGEVMPFPFRQKDIADALGMTIAHVNRTLKSLRDVCTIDLHTHELRIDNLAALTDLAAQTQAGSHHDAA